MEEPDVNPYQTPEVPVHDPTPERRDFRLASLGARFGAWLLDSLFWFLASLPWWVGIGSLGARMGSSREVDPEEVFREIGPYFACSGLLSLILLVLNVVFVAQNSQSLGKRLVGIRVVTTDGHPAGFLRILFLRNMVPGLLYVLPQLLAPILGPVAWLLDTLPIFGRKRQCVHDLIAGTQVAEYQRPRRRR